MPKPDGKVEDVKKLFEDLQTGNHEPSKKEDTAPKYKQFIVGLVEKGQIIGMEEHVFGKLTTYNTGCVCLSLKAELFQIDRDYFMKALS